MGGQVIHFESCIRDEYVSAHIIGDTQGGMLATTEEHVTEGREKGCVFAADPHNNMPLSEGILTDELGNALFELRIGMSYED
jgi:hypothetical protein